MGNVSQPVEVNKVQSLEINEPTDVELNQMFSEFLCLLSDFEGLDFLFPFLNLYIYFKHLHATSSETCLRRLLTFSLSFDSCSSDVS